MEEYDARDCFLEAPLRPGKDRLARGAQTRRAWNNIVKGTVLLMGRANPTFQKRQKEVKRLEKNQAKREAREARKNMTPEELAAKRLEEEQNNMEVLNHPDNLPATDDE